MNESESKECQIIGEQFFEGFMNTLQNISKNIDDWFNSLPPYLKFEILHPRKKPRGSIRRARKEQE